MMELVRKCGALGAPVCDPDSINEEACRGLALEFRIQNWRARRGARRFHAPRRAPPLPARRAIVRFQTRQLFRAFEPLRVVRKICELKSELLQAQTGEGKYRWNLIPSIGNRFKIKLEGALVERLQRAFLRSKHSLFFAKNYILRKIVKFHGNFHFEHSARAVIGNDAGDNRNLLIQKICRAAQIKASEVNLRSVGLL